MAKAPPVDEEAPYRTIQTPKRVRARAGGRFLADSVQAKLVSYGGMPFHRTYAFPREDVLERLLRFGPEQDHPELGPIQEADLELDGREVQGIARLHGGNGTLAGHISLEWDRVDAWFEEDEEVHVHPRDPYHRIDVLQSSRHVVVEVDGVGVAESRHPVVLFETNLPPRYYLPQTDVRPELLEPSEKETGCPYKGTAHYRHLVVDGKRHDDLIWTYPAPFEGVLKIQGLLAFFQERVDLYVDGALQERPDTPWRD